jgi:hypothetical protein
MVLDDFVMLGKTVPETNSDGRVFVCTAGYSIELKQPIRIYPMAMRDCPSRWSVSRVPLERNPKDARRESWKIRGERTGRAHAVINRVVDPVRTRLSEAEQIDVLRSMAVSSIAEANERRMSLAVIFPTDLPRITLEEGEQVEMAATPDMFGTSSDLPPVSARFRWHPRLRFRDAGGDHDLMLRDWGCYELMRKRGDAAAMMLSDALNLGTSPPLLCGNLNRFRNSWLVISVFAGAAHARPDIADRQYGLFDAGFAA